MYLLRGHLTPDYLQGCPAQATFMTESTDAVQICHNSRIYRVCEGTICEYGSESYDEIGGLLLKR